MNKTDKSDDGDLSNDDQNISFNSTKDEDKMKIDIIIKVRSILFLFFY